MIKTLISSLALAFVAFSANALVAPRAAHAAACSDLQAVIQNPQGGTGGAAAADAIKARAQILANVICATGAAADGSAPTNTPAQLGAADTPSTCAAYSDPPMPAAGATHAQIGSSVGAFNTWASANTPALSCHHDEITRAQRETAIYDAAALVWQQQFTTQVTQLQTSFDAQRAVFMRAHANQ